MMDAVQVMRQKAEQSGNLKTTPQQNVTTQGSTIIIQPANPDVVYIPAYDPWLVYGGPIGPWPGWYEYPGIWFGGPYLSFGIGFGIGFFGGFGWGWGHWGFDSLPSPATCASSISSRSPRRSTSCTSFPNRTDMDRSARPWRSYAETRVRMHYPRRVFGAPGNTDTPPVAQPPCAR